MPQDQSKYKKKPSNWFLKIVIVTLIPLSFFVNFLLDEMKEKLIKNTVDDLTSIVKTTHMTITDIFVRNQINDAEALVKTKDFIEHAKNILSTSTESEVAHQKSLDSLRALLGPFLNTHNALGIFLISKDGKNIASMRDSNLGHQNLISLQRPGCFRRVCLGESLLISPIKSDVPLESSEGIIINQYPTMFVAVPVKNAMDQVMAIFTVRLDPFSSFSQIARNARIKTSGETYLFDSRGTLITESRFNKQLHELGLINDPNISLLQIQIRDPGKKLSQSKNRNITTESTKEWPLTFMAQQAIKNKEFGRSTTPYRDYRGVMVYGAWLWDNNHDIGFTTEIDMDEALTPYYEIRRLASILLGGMIFMTTVLILLIFKDQKKYRNEIEGLYLDLEQKYQEKTQHLRDSEFELKVSTKKAQQANEAKSNFLANMSHEIRTPINGILGFTDILAESNLDDEQKKCTSIIVKSSRSLLVIINDILDFSKIEAGKMSFEKISMDINLVVDDVLKLYSEKAIEKGIVISKRADPNIPHYILGDPTRINQIILNLFSNAIKFTEKGSITINLKVESSAHDNSSNLRIEIKDTGIGITKEQQENIFDSFTQADLSTTRKFGGTGLGTTISQRLVKLMGGDIGVESEPGVGSCFYFAIPLETTKDNLSS